MAAIPLSVALSAWPGWVAADEPLTLHTSYSGNNDFFATGAAMAIDGPDDDTTRVDTLLHPATTEIDPVDLPPGASLRDAFLYWGGSITDANDCADPGNVDDTVSFTPPGQATTEVVADHCYCSPAGAQSYDIQLCRAQVTNLLGELDGSYALDDFDALIANASTNNASFSIVLVYSAPELPVRKVSLYDGLLTMWSQGVAEEVVVLDQITVDNPAVGDLTWYALEGDVGGGGDESVSVSGAPGGLTLDLEDAINPVTNPMNHTINTTTPVQTESLGVDIDFFSIDEALTANDTSVEITYRGGGDKYWIAYNIVGVNLFAPDFAEASTKTWALQEDADESGSPSPGDTIRYTLYVENTGDVEGLLSIDDPIPAQLGSWMLIDTGGGVDLSMADTLIVGDIALAPGESTAVVFDGVIADDAGGEVMVNVATWDAGDDGNGILQAAPVEIADTGIGGDGDGDPTGDGDGDPATGDGDGDPAMGDGDGDPAMGDGDGDATTTSGSGEDTGGEDEGSGDEDTGTSGAPMFVDGSGCNCSTGDEGPWGLALMVLALVGLRSTRRDEKA